MFAGSGGIDMIKQLLAGTLLLSFIAPVGADAHHSRPAFFDMSQTVEIAGEITRVQWRHPHVRYWIRTDPEFGGDIWELETTPPSLLERQGITREILSAGTHVRVAGPPSKVAENAMEASHVLLPLPRWVPQRRAFISTGDKLSLLWQRLASLPLRPYMLLLSKIAPSTR